MNAETADKETGIDVQVRSVTLALQEINPRATRYSRVTLADSRFRAPIMRLSAADNRHAGYS
jgi:hypothetical protein